MQLRIFDLNGGFLRKTRFLYGKKFLHPLYLSYPNKSCKSFRVRALLTKFSLVHTHYDFLTEPRLATGLNLYENCERFRDLNLNLAMLVTPLCQLISVLSALISLNDFKKLTVQSEYRVTQMY